jgi:CysZ protein
MGLIADIAKALGQMGDPRFLRVLWRALAITVLGLAVVFWAVVAGLGWLLPDTVSLPWIGPVGFLDDVASWAAIGLMLVLSVVLMVPTAAAVVGFFLDDIAAAVEARYYPGLPPAVEPGVGEQLADAGRFLGLVVAVNLVALAVYLLVPPLAPFAFWLVNGFLLGREYFQLVAMRRLGRAGAAVLGRRHAGRIWVAGTAMAVPLSVPVLNLLVPVVGVAVFTHQFHRLARAGSA